MQTIKRFLFVLMICGAISCATSTSEKPAKDSVVNNTEDIPAERQTVNTEPVKTYEESVKSFETTDQFKVSLLETKKTFNYLIKMHFKGLDEVDTLRVPNFGTQPLVEIQKGDSVRPSCIVGFLDKDKQFRESKLIYFANDKLKVKVLKYYAVSVYTDTAK